jgi:hypothetical protein
MATGDQGDMLRRIKAVLPNRWFNAPTPNLDAVLSGFASALAWAFSLVSFAGEQVLIDTSSGPFLDLHAQDFFGLNGFPRRTNETDSAYAARLLPAIFPPGNTREAMTQALVGLTGQSPWIFEPSRPADTGAWNNGSSLAYNAAGGYGSLLLPYQAFVVARRGYTETIGNIGGYLNALWVLKQQSVAPSGWNVSSSIAYNTAGGCGVITDSFQTFSTGTNSPALYAPGGYGAGALGYASTSMIGGAVSDSDIYSVIESVEPAGSIMWSNIQDIA